MVPDISRLSDASYPTMATFTTEHPFSFTNSLTDLDANQQLALDSFCTQYSLGVSSSLLAPESLLCAPQMDRAELSGFFNTIPNFLTSVPLENSLSSSSADLSDCSQPLASAPSFQRVDAAYSLGEPSQVALSSYGFGDSLISAEANPQPPSPTTSEPRPVASRSSINFGAVLVPTLPPQASVMALPTTSPRSGGFQIAATRSPSPHEAAGPSSPSLTMPSISRTSSRASPDCTGSSSNTSVDGVYTPPIPALSPRTVDNSFRRPQRTHKKRIKLSAEDKKNIIAYVRANPDVRQKDVARMYNVERSTISKYLGKVERQEREAMTQNPHAHPPATTKRTCGPRFPDIEDEVRMWILMHQDRYSMLPSDSDIRAKAKQVAMERGRSAHEFRASSKWISNVKGRIRVELQQAALEVAAALGMLSPQPIQLDSTTAALPVGLPCERASPPITNLEELCAAVCDSNSETSQTFEYPSSVAYTEVAPDHQNATSSSGSPPDSFEPTPFSSHFTSNAASTENLTLASNQFLVLPEHLQQSFLATASGQSY